MNIAELIASKELSLKLTTADITRMQTLIRAPEGLCDNVSDVPLFLLALRQWNQHSPFRFYTALKDTRPDLIETACKIPWLCVSSPSDCEQEGEELSIKSLIDLLRSEITKSNWILIYMAVTNEAGDNIGFEITLNKMLEKGLIERDLTTLSEILKGIQRRSRR